MFETERRRANDSSEMTVGRVNGKRRDVGTLAQPNDALIL
jgi:hypothetical protein